MAAIKNKTKEPKYKLAKPGAWFIGRKMVGRKISRIARTAHYYALHLIAYFGQEPDDQEIG